MLTQCPKPFCKEEHHCQSEDKRLGNRRTYAAVVVFVSIGLHVGENLEVEQDEEQNATDGITGIAGLGSVLEDEVDDCNVEQVSCSQAL